MKLDDHNAFHSILNKYIPENPSSRQRGQLIEHLKNNYSTVEEQRRYYITALEKAYDEFAATSDGGSLNYYKDFMVQVKNKLETKANVSSINIDLDQIKSF